MPVVAAGGIFDGRGLAAALALGADGVWIGTRFIATPEARSAPGYKDALLRTPEDGTTISRAFSGKTMRVVANETSRYFEEHPEELKKFPEQLIAGHRGRLDAPRRERDDRRASIRTASATRPARASARSTSCVPAGDIVRSIVAEAETPRSTASRSIHAS